MTHKQLQLRPGGFWLLRDGESQQRVYRAQDKGRTWIRLDGQTQTQSQGADTGRSSEDRQGEDQDLVAQFPGKVRKIFVKAGQEVTAGQDLLAVEAMKMEFSVKAPRSGKVRAVLVEEGQSLAPGQRMIDMEDA